MPTSDERSDDELIQAANRGETAAFEALYLRYRDWTRRLAYRFTRNPQDALDVLQDTFAYLLKKFPGFELKAKMTTFLYPVVKNAALARRRGQHATVSDDDVLAAIPDASARPDDTTRQELAAALVALSDPQREVLLMRFLDEMSIAEIAAALGTPEGTVKSRLHNALGVLRADPRTRRYFEP